MAENAPTIIGDSILVSGHLQGEEDLTVQGRVHGTVNLTKTLVIEESGVVKADVSVRNAIVSGVVVGNVTATDSVELTDVGRMVGDINAPRVIIVEGARFRGNVDMGDLEAPRATAPLPTRTVDRGSLSRSTPSRSVPERRPMATSTPTPTPTPTRPVTTAAKAEEKSAPAAAPAGGKKGKPLVGKKKIKKKVVVKKRG